MALISKIQAYLSSRLCSAELIAILCFVFFLYLAATALYRLYFSPLAGFPGPTLTALTQWYEVYCEILKNGGGQFTFQIHEWHREYGILSLN